MKATPRHRYRLMILLASLSGPVPLLAQETGSSGGSEGPEMQPVCMTRPQDNVAQVRPEHRGRDFHIMAAGRSVPGLEAKGFEVAECSGSSLGNRSELVRYRNRMCTLAATGNEAVQNQLERALGERPAVLCANAELIAGRWQGERETEEAQE